jgi:hypothetical protein
VFDRVRYGREERVGDIDAEVRRGGRRSFSIVDEKGKMLHEQDSWGCPTQQVQ